MKKLIAALCALTATSLLFVGCSTGPDAVALKFEKLIENGDVEKASELATGHLRQELVSAAAAGEIEKPSGKSAIRVVETKIDGDKAKVTLERIANGEPETNKWGLVKEGGNWKVDDLIIFDK